MKEIVPAKVEGHDLMPRWETQPLAQDVEVNQHPGGLLDVLHYLPHNWGKPPYAGIPP